jgi:putative ABC transport system substrate-binding protein
MMHGHEKSDPATVAVKPTSKAERSAAEPVEPRAGTKGNAGQQSTRQTQSWARVSQALDRIRQFEPCVRFAVTHPRWEPHAGKPHVRICAAGARQLAFLPLRRRQFIGLLGSAMAWPLAAGAQQTVKVYRLGLLGGSPPNSPGGRRAWEGFFQGMRELGYVDGQNILIEGRFYGDHTERLPGLAAELVQLNVDVIVAGAAPAPEAAQHATATIPIVMAIHIDPVASGLVASLASPGKNVTGLSLLGPELVGKRLQLLKEVLPGSSRVALLSNPTDPTQAFLLREAQVAARSLKMQLQVVELRTPSELAGAFTTMTRESAEAVVILTSSMFYDHRIRIAELAAQSRLPAIYSLKDYADAGGFMTYGVNLGESFRRAATYVDEILKGAKPADLPVEQPTKFELVINLKTAKALGIALPPSLLSQADELIE